jgi:hypothetical protein
MQVFKIVNVSRADADTVFVKVRIDAKEWLKLKKSGQLGALYGIDISNAVYALYGVKASNPTVSDKDSAMGGIKWIDLWYRDSEWAIKDNVINVDFKTKKRIAA